MNRIPISYTINIPQLLHGRLEKSAEGELFLRTAKGFFPVKLEGDPIPLGREFAFKLLRHEPGRVILTPLSRWEFWQEALPFLKELPGADRGEWENLIRAAVRQELPLEKEVLLALRRWSLTAEKNWGVKVDPEVFAFLLRRDLPVTPGTVLLTLYLLFPGVQKEVWLNTMPPALGGHSKEEEVTPERLQELIASALDRTTGRMEGEKGLRGLWTGILQAASRFLAGQARQEELFPHYVFYLTPRQEQVARWEGLGRREEEAEKGYSFRLTWNSAVLGQVEVTGVERKEGLELLIGAGEAAVKSYPELWRAFDEIRSYLENRGWKVKNLTFSRLNRKKGEQPQPFFPPRIDGWV